MKHSIRQRFINGLGQPVTITPPVICELGSGVLDCQAREIFEGDYVKLDGQIYPVTFHDAAFWVDKATLFNFTDGELEIVDKPAEADE